MAGLELTAPKIKFPTTVLIEVVDTRVKKPSMGSVGQTLCIIIALMIILIMTLW